MGTKKQISFNSILSLHKSDTISLYSLNVNVYKNKLSELNLKDLNFDHRKQFPIDSNVKESVISTFQRNISETCRYLVLEVFEKDFSNNDFEELFSGIRYTIASLKYLKALIIAVSEKSLLADIIYYKELKDFCSENEISFCIMDSSSVHELDTRPSQSELSDSDILKDFQKLYDHFEISVNGVNYHTPVVASLNKLSKNRKFIDKLNHFIYSEFKEKPFLIKTYGISGGDANTVALELQNTCTNKTKIIDSLEDTINDFHSLLIFCDFLAPYYSLDTFIASSLNAGITKVLLIGIEKFKNFNITNGKVKVIFFKDANHISYQASQENCIFCLQGDIPLKGDQFEAYQGQLKHYNNIKFWEFLNQDALYFQSQHWISPTTRYHYLFRPISDQIFKENLFNIATRAYNIFKEKHLDEKSIAKILCPDEPASRLLADGLAEKWALDKETDIIPIPRKYLSYAGFEIPIGLSLYLQNNGYEIHPKQTVMIIDQAAHNYKTLTALERISQHYRGNIIGTLVFIDRTADNISAFLKRDTYPYFVSLFRWSIQPKEANACPCERV